ncbi:MAG: tetratricopeptide repeat protein [Robiginitomaculum sp.]|nr:tetratricopeptide repeat protein [Robiginitomaculum sp.]
MRAPFRILFINLTLVFTLVGCVTATEKDEIAFAEQMVRDIRPESRTARDAIERQDILTQATFWAEEYEINPADREAALKLARIVRTLGNPRRATAIGSQALALFPDDLDLLLVTGQALIEDGHAGNAISYLQLAHQQDPNNASVLSALGVAYDQTNRHELALSAFKQALGLRPEDSKILSNIGISHALQGEPSIAETWLRRAAALPGADGQVRQNLALVLSLQGRFAEAETLAAQDMPDGVAKENIQFVKSMINRPNAWEALRGE